MLFHQVGHYHAVSILVSYRRDPEGAVGMNAHHCIASTVRFFHPVGELYIRVAGSGQHYPLKGRKVSKILGLHAQTLQDSAMATIVMAVRREVRRQ